MLFDLAMAIVLRLLKSKMPSREKELSRKFNKHLDVFINFSVPNHIRCLLFLLRTEKFIFTYNMLLGGALRSLLRLHAFLCVPTLKFVLHRFSSFSASFFGLMAQWSVRARFYTEWNGRQLIQARFWARFYTPKWQKFRMVSWRLRYFAGNKHQLSQNVLINVGNFSF